MKPVYVQQNGDSHTVLSISLIPITRHLKIEPYLVEERTQTINKFKSHRKYLKISRNNLLQDLL